MKEFLTVRYYGLIVMSFIGINGQVCNDIDFDVCNRLSQQRPDMCSDSCLSSICTRFCGRCPLKCFKCHEIDHPANCKTIVDCNSSNQYCFTVQTFTDNFEVRYNMGCAMKNLCEQNVNAGKRSDLSAKGGCCSTDNCNNKLPSEIDLLPHRTTLMFQNTTALPIINVCENLDNDICLRISIVDPSFCSNDCIASHICPRKCRKCFQCYECINIDKPTDCNHIRTCTVGKECYQLQTITSDLRPVYTLGCLDKNFCERLDAPIQTGFGRRQTGKVLTGGCCKTDLCNRGTSQQMKEATTTNPPTVHYTHASGEIIQCYECNYLNTPTDCNNTRTCTAGKECFQLQSISSDLRPVFTLGCLDKSLCHRFGASIQIGYGRRQTGVSLTGGCCKTDLCNRGTLQQMQEVTTTHDPILYNTQTSAGINCTLNQHNIVNHCSPKFFYEIRSHSCYHVGAQRLTWQESVAYCNGICGRLADFGTLVELHYVPTVLASHYSGYLSKGLWIDAVKDTLGNWISSNNNIHLIRVSSLYCAAVANMGRFNPRLHSCGDALYPLCETASVL